MRCARCETKTDAGAAFTIYFGTHAKPVASPSESAQSTDLVAGSEQVFLCFACQIAQRHREFRETALASVVVAMISFLAVGLIQFPSMLPQALIQPFSALVDTVISTPWLAIPAGLGIALAVGAIALYAIRVFGASIWSTCTWQKPYAASGDGPDLDATSEGERFAIRLRQADLKRQGYDAFFTRKAYSQLGRSGSLARVAATAAIPLALFTLFLFVLTCIALGSLLARSTH